MIEPAALNSDRGMNLSDCDCAEEGEADGGGLHGFLGAETLISETSAPIHVE